MRLIRPSYEIIEQEPGIEGVYKQIELAARNCYKSEPVEGVTSKDFVDRMINRGHLSTLEHGTVYLKISSRTNEAYKYKLNPYSKVVDFHTDSFVYITSNLRVLQENGWLNDLQYLCRPIEFHEKRVTVKFTSNIHFYKDLTRHRKMSFAIESTRYCNYNKEKFGAELTFIIPSWLPLEEGSYDVYEIDEMDGECGDFLRGLKVSEEVYLKMINFYKWQAQQAAEVLPQATKADIIVTGFISDWKHIFNLRTSTIAATGKPHPEVSRLMDPLYKEFQEKFK